MPSISQKLMLTRCLEVGELYLTAELFTGAQIARTWERFNRALPMSLAKLALFNTFLPENLNLTMVCFNQIHLHV